MILHSEVFNELAQINCYIDAIGITGIREQIQIFCNSKDSVKYLEAKAMEMIEQENGKIPFVAVIKFSILERLPLDKPIQIKMSTIDTYQIINPQKQQT